ncbi:Lon protease 2-like protein [Drosera capensis]
MATAAAAAAEVLRNMRRNDEIDMGRERARKFHLIHTHHRGLRPYLSKCIFVITHHYPPPSRLRFHHPICLCRCRGLVLILNCRIVCGGSVVAVDEGVEHSPKYHTDAQTLSKTFANCTTTQRYPKPHPKPQTETPLQTNPNPSSHTTSPPPPQPPPRRLRHHHISAATTTNGPSSPSPSDNRLPTTTKPPKNPTLPPPIHVFHSITSTTRRRRLRFRCSASNHHNSSLTDAVELPLFPLPLVLFPGAVLPLQIFEFRYRIMMHTLLHTDLRFGVIFSDSVSGNADVGCVADVVKHERLADDRFFLICKGQERFRIDRITRSRPYLVAEVSWLEDKPSKESSGGEEDDLEVLSAEVEAYMRDVIRLSNRLNGKGGDEKEVGDLRRKMWPTPFSFFVGSTFEGAPREQQALLELEDTASRLRREKETLRNTLNYLSAASAVKNVFPSSSTS